MSASGEASPTTAGLAFSVRPAWWQTGWFRLGVAVLLGTGAYLLARWRTRHLLARAQQLERRVAERTQEVSEVNRRLEEAQSRLAELVETAGRAQEDLPAWASAAAADIARIVGAREIGVFTLDGDAVSPLGGSPLTAPTAQEVRAAENRANLIAILVISACVAATLVEQVAHEQASVVVDRDVDGGHHRPGDAADPHGRST